MKNILDVKEYVDEINEFAKRVNLKFLENKTLFIAGASGLIMSYFIDTLIASKIKVKIIALSSTGKARERFKNNKKITYIVSDVRNPEIVNAYKGKIDYIFNFASLVDPKSYLYRPIDTMTINLLGTYNLLNLAVKKKAKFFFASSCEVYGELNKIGIKEDDFGLVNTMDPRSCYNESKRACETLCICYAKEHNIKTYIGRFSRVYGPTMNLNDTKALSQFINNALKGEDIVLKSNGNQKFSYIYVQDAVSAIVNIIKKESSNIEYNITSNELLTLHQIAVIIANERKVNVKIVLTTDKLKQGYSKTLISSLNTNRLKKLGWRCSKSHKINLNKTLSILYKTIQ